MLYVLGSAGAHKFRFQRCAVVWVAFVQPTTCSTVDGREVSRCRVADCPISAAVNEEDQAENKNEKRCAAGEHYSQEGAHAYAK